MSVQPRTLSPASLDMEGKARVVRPCESTGPGAHPLLIYEAWCLHVGRSIFRGPEGSGLFSYPTAIVFTPRSTSPRASIALCAVIVLTLLTACSGQGGGADSASAGSGGSNGATSGDSASRAAGAATVGAASQRVSTGDETLPAGVLPKRPRRDSVALESMTRPDSVLDKLWPVKMPAPLAGAILPNKRIVAYYGNPLSKKMGVLGEFPKDEMLAKLDREVANWAKADPSHPVVPALHLIVTVAQGAPGKNGLYRLQMRDSLVNEVYSWIKAKGRHLLRRHSGGQEHRAGGAAAPTPHPGESRRASRARSGILHGAVGGRCRAARSARLTRRT